MLKIAFLYRNGVCSKEQLFHIISCHWFTQYVGAEAKMKMTELPFNFKGMKGQGLTNFLLRKQEV